MALPVGLKHLGAALNFSQFVLLPIAEPWPVVRITEPGHYEPVAELPCGLAQQARIQDARRATVLSEERDRVDVYEWTAGALARVGSVPLPQDMHATDAVLKGPLLVVSGGYRWPSESTDVLIARRIDGGEWFSLTTPADVARPGKVVDALLVDGDRLIAVDDRSRPKRFLEFDLKDPERPTFLRMHELVQEPSELVHAAVLGARFFALRSTAHHDRRLSRTLRLYDRRTLIECAHVSAYHSITPDSADEVRDPLGRRTLVSRLDWRDFAFVGGTLLVAGGREGLGVLDTTEVKVLQPVGPQQRRPAPVYLSDQLLFEPPPPGAETVAIVPVPSHGGAFVVTEHDSVRSLRWWG